MKRAAEEAAELADVLGKLHLRTIEQVGDTWFFEWDDSLTAAISQELLVQVEEPLEDLLAVLHETEAEKVLAVGLEDCPMCGDVPVLEPVDFSDEVRMHRISCDCGVACKPVDSPHQAIQLWNRRCATTPIMRLVAP